MPERLSTPAEPRAVTTRRRFPDRWIEPFFAAFIFAGLCHAMWHFYTRGYLPQPFFYSPFDMWGDWYNVVYWAYDKGSYDAYKAVYPPLSFLFVRIFSFTHCYPVMATAGNPSIGIYSRNCDWLGLVAFNAIFVVNIILVARTYTRNDRKTAFFRSYALTAGFPMLEAFEHANLIMMAFMGVVLAFGNLVRSARARWLMVAFAVNFKIYIIATIFPQLLRRKWLWVEGALLTTVIVYGVTYCLFGRGTPAELYENITAFGDTGAASFLDVWFPATNAALISLAGGGLLRGLIGSYPVDQILFWLPLLQHITQAAIVFAALACFLRPEVVSRYRITNLGISLALITVESGGYTVVLIFFFTFFEPWRGFARKWAIVACYVLCIPLDIPVANVQPFIAETYFPSNTIIEELYVMIGPFVRPTLLLTVPFALSLLTIGDVWRDIRTQGWRSRWRFRRDLPLLTGAGAVVPPRASARAV